MLSVAIKPALLVMLHYRQAQFGEIKHKIFNSFPLKFSALKMQD